MSATAVRAVAGTAVALRGDDIDTDRLVPARFVASVPLAELGRVVLAEDRARVASGDPPHPFDDPRYRGARVLVVERNFGCGSSREHAVVALAGWGQGIAAVVGISFSTIFQANALANGIPCASVDRRAAEHLLRRVESDPGTRVVVSVDAGSVALPGEAWTAPVAFAPGSRQRLLDGTWDPLDHLLSGAARIAAVADLAPYGAWATTAPRPVPRGGQRCDG